MLAKIISQKRALQASQQAEEEYRNLIRREAKIGGKIFGPIPKGHKREFFCLDRHSWVWHEEWIDKNNVRHVQTTRYDVRPSAIIKMQEGIGYTALSLTEAKHFAEAVKIYHHLVTSEYNSILQQYNGQTA